MSLELKTNVTPAMTIPWQPTASLENLRVRAQVLDQIRTFFKARSVLEVDTPLLGHCAALDPHLDPIPALYLAPGQKENKPLYLQTSPEFAMKRLLAAGSGPIYQLGKAFRNGETGRFHNPEFTVLEWYRPGFTHHALMDEIEELLFAILATEKSVRLSYTDLFLEKLELHPLKATLAELQNCALAHQITIPVAQANTLTTDDWLDILMTHKIEPELGFEVPIMVFDYPASKAALAKVRNEIYPVAERFEVYVRGVELANGYHELTDALQQQVRFVEECEMRKKLGLRNIPIDNRLLMALKAGLPDCAGVALGVDRLLMLKLNCHSIDRVMPFTIDRA